MVVNGAIESVRMVINQMLAPSRNKTSPARNSHTHNGVSFLIDRRLIRCFDPL